MGDIGRAIGEMIAALVLVAVIFVPLGIWKAVEIVVWLFSHVIVRFS